MKKTLTIVIPTYNMEELLEKDLASLIVREELMDALEVLVVNDGSKDSSLDIGKSYQNKYPQTFRVIDKPNGNYGSCINRGLKESTGRYIKIMDADDRYEKNGFERLIEFLQSSDYDLVLTDVIVDFTVRNKSKKLDLDLPKQRGLSFAEFENCRNLNKISMHAIAYKTSILKNINYIQTEGISYTDQEWLYLPMASVNSVFYLNTPVYHYYIGREGQTMNRKTILKSVSQREKILFRMLEQYNDIAKDQTDSHRNYLYSRLLFMAKGLYEDYLVKTPMIDGKETKEFDDTLRKYNKQLYIETAGLKMPRINKYKYVDAWRSNSYIRTFPVRLYGVVFRIMAKIIK